MKKILFMLTVISLPFFMACNKDEKEAGSKSEANQQFDQSNYGIYRGIFVGSSGVIAINLGNNGNSPFAILIIDGVTYNFTTIETVTQNANTSILFTQGNNSFVFSVDADGRNPIVRDINIAGHPDAVITVNKETSSTVVACYEGTYQGDYSFGTFNMVISGNSIVALTDAFTGSGTVTGNSIIGSGSAFGNTVFFIGEKNGENEISGTWDNPGFGEQGTWRTTRRYITTFEN